MAAMALFELNDVTFTYPDQTAPALSDIRLSIAQGEFILLCGPSGCGKTTLLRHLKPELAPVGELRGDIRYEGKPFAEHAPLVLSERIGMVQQDPENQIVMDRVAQELAFGLENMGVETQAIRRRIAELAHFFGMEDWLRRETHTLSGGQKQLLNLASVLLLQPGVLLLDEPTAQLDPVAARELIQMIRRLHEEFGLTIIMTEHRLEELFPLADRVLVMDRLGAIRWTGTPREVARQLAASGDPDYLAYMPSPSRLFMGLAAQQEQAAAALSTTADASAELPLTVGEGRRALRLAGLPPLPASERGGDGQGAYGSAGAKLALLECRELTFQYEQHGKAVVRQLDLRVDAGDFMAIVGGNGAGKSTLLQLMAGLLKPQRGSIRLKGQELRRMKAAEAHRVIGYLSQNPSAYFIHETVGEELRSAAERSGEPEAGQRLERLVELLDLGEVLQRHPYDLSGGERQKAALACVLLASPQLLLLDEPTKGLDPNVKQAWGEWLQTLHEQGMTIVLVTHDIEFAAKYATRCAMLFDGEVTSEGPPRAFFSENYFYTTTIHRLVREVAPQALTVEEVLALWRTGGLR